MDHIRSLVARDFDDEEYDLVSPQMYNLVVALLALVCFALALVGILYLLRRRRQTQKESILPQHSRTSNHRRLTITAAPYNGSRTQSVYVYNEKRELMENSDSPPPSPVPEIRITFPDEEDREGKRTSGKVVVVRIGDSGTIGMEPVNEDHLPPYHSSDAERYQSLDLDRMGGLREKETRPYA